MDDVSSLLPGDPVSALIGGSVMDGGGQVADTSEAFSGPGTRPVMFPDHNVQEYGPPRIGTTPMNNRPNVTGGSDYAPSPVTWKAD